MDRFDKMGYNTVMTFTTRPFAHLALGVVLALPGCDEVNKDPPEDPQDTGALDPPPGETAVDYSMSRLAPPPGCAVPEPRRFHAMAWFHAADPVEVGDWFVERGFVVVGGIAVTDGSYLDDLWLYDLTNWRPTGCPWVQVRGAGAVPGATGVAGASLVYDEDLQQFHLIGGHRENAGTKAASAAIDVLDIEDVAVGAFVSQDLLEPLTYSTWEEGDPECATPHDAQCFDLGDPACPLLDSVAVDGCSGAALGPWNVPGCNDQTGESPPWPQAYNGCFPDTDQTVAPDAPDPLCNAAATGLGGDSYRVDRAVAGLSQFATLFDPLSLPASAGGTTWIVGGTTGCTGTCAAWLDLAASDRRPTPAPTLSVANFEGVVELRGGVWTGVSDLGMGPWKVPPYTSPAGVSVEWWAEATEGPRFSAGVLTGRRWDPDDKRWVAVPESEGYWLVGGTMAQKVGPRAKHAVELHDGLWNAADPNDCFDDLWPSADRWEENPPATSFFPDLDGDGVVEEAEAGVATGIVKIDGDVLVDAHVVAPPPPRLYQAAAVAVEEDAFVVVGGATYDTPAGTDEVWVVDADPALAHPVASVVAAEPGQSEARFGAGAVFDPIERRAYVFGGGATSDVFRVYAEANAVVADVGSAYEVLEADVEYAFVPDPGAPTPADPGYLARGTWAETVSYRMRHTCTSPAPVAGAEPPRCFADRIALQFGDPDVDGDATLEEKTDDNVTIEVVRADGARFPMGPRLVEGDGDGLVALQQDDEPGVHGRTDDSSGAVDSHTFRLPWAVSSGEELTLVVTWADADPADALRGGVPYFGKAGQKNKDGAIDLHQLLAFGAHRVALGDANCRDSHAIALRSLSVWPGRQPVASAEVPAVPVDHIHLVPPLPAPGRLPFTGVGIGPETPCALGDFGGFTALAAGGVCSAPALQVGGSGLRLLVIQGLAPVPVDGATLAYVHACLSAQADVEIEYHFASGAFTLDAEAAEGWLGPNPVPARSVVFAPPYVQPTGVLGTTTPGSIVVTAFDAAGGVDRDPPGWMTASDWRATLAHEWVHLWMGTRRVATAEARWFQEGVPSLVETMLYPDDADNRSRLVSGQSLLVANTVFDLAADLESNGGTVEVAYYMAPYTLAQLLHTAWASDPTGYGSAEQVLGALGDALFPPGPLYEPLTGPAPLEGYDPEVDPAPLELVFEAIGAWSFYGQWVAADRLGTPVIGLTAAVDPATGAITVQAGQVQPTGLLTAAGTPFPEVDQVPVFLGCAPLGATSPSAGCQLAEGGDPVGPPVLVPAGGAIPVATASRVAVLAGGALLPGHVGHYAISDGVAPIDGGAGGLPVAPTWFTVCPAGATDPACVTDVDADGWPVGGDCVDGDAAVNPGAVDLGPWDLTLLPPLDLNCDGAPSPAWTNPSATESP
ncbi:MAG: hypothetical protein ABMA64_02730 [Myxococcota bacterium]